MQPGKTTAAIVLLYSVIIYGNVACSNDAKSPSVDFKQINVEIEAIDTLLRDASFAEFMARSLDSAYYAGIGEAQPVFLKSTDDTAVQLIRLKDEKVATSIAGFYALECGAELLSKNSKETFTSWLQKIIKGDAGPDAVLLLNRFANATWKAGQPFRDMERLKRYNFRVASLLTKEEIDKDSIQIENNAKKLFALMQPATRASQEDQMKLLRTILQDTLAAVRMSSYADSTFAVSQHQGTTAPNPADTAMVRKTVKQMKIATSIAGFYALECCLNYLATTKNELPSKILSSLVNDSLSNDDKMLFARFANATWKAGQPFRGLNRITRETFTPFYFLSEADIDKDLVQVKAAGKILLTRMQQNVLQ
jgi:hypothetical protein